jgi:hypothetical protein
MSLPKITQLRHARTHQTHIHTYTHQTHTHTHTHTHVLTGVCDDVAAVGVARHPLPYHTLCVATAATLHPHSLDDSYLCRRVMAGITLQQAKDLSRNHA